MLQPSQTCIGQTTTPEWVHTHTHTHVGQTAVDHALSNSTAEHYSHFFFNTIFREVEKSVGGGGGGGEGGMLSAYNSRFSVCAFGGCVLFSVSNCFYDIQPDPISTTMTLL